MYIYPILAALVVSIVSLVGILIFRKGTLFDEGRAPYLPLSVGAFLAVAFFELLPEAFHESEWASFAVAGGFLGFFLLSRLLHEYHHHHQNEDGHEHRERGALVLIGDAIHNFCDGIVIAVAFSVDPLIGVATTAGVILHEVPQEIAELYILLSAGYSRTKALLYNFGSALSVVLGTIVALFVMDKFEPLFGIMIGIAAGNLLYIAASDLLPNLAQSVRAGSREARNQFVLVLIGLALVGALLTLTHEREEEARAPIAQDAVVLAVLV